MAMSATLAKREGEIDLKEKAMRLRHRALALASDHKAQLDKLKSKASEAVENGKAAVVTSAVARGGGMALEAYSHGRLDEKLVNMMGPAGAFAAVVSYTLGLSSKNPKESALYLTLGGVGEGLSSRWLLAQLDTALRKK